MDDFVQGPWDRNQEGENQEDCEINKIVMGIVITPIIISVRLIWSSNLKSGSNPIVSTSKNLTTHLSDIEIDKLATYTKGTPVGSCVEDLGAMSADGWGC